MSLGGEDGHEGEHLFSRLNQLEADTQECTQHVHKDCERNVGSQNLGEDAREEEDGPPLRGGSLDRHHHSQQMETGDQDKEEGERAKHDQHYSAGRFTFSLQHLDISHPVTTKRVRR